MKRSGFFCLFLASLACGDMVLLEKLYQEKRYAEVLAHAKELKGEYANAALHLLWAKSAQALGKEEEAISAYERVLLLDPENKNAGAELYKLYTKTSRHELASELATSLHLPQKDQKNLSFVSAKAGVEVGYDTNVNMSATASDLNDYFGFYSGEGEKDSLFSRFNGGLLYRDDLGTKGGWFAQGELQLTYQNNKDAHRYDMLYTALGGGLGYRFDRSRVYVPIYFEKLHYLDTDLYTQIKLEPKFGFYATNKLFVDINLLYTNRDFTPSQYRSMDHKSYGFGSTLYYSFEKNYLYASFEYEDFHPSQNAPRRYVDKKNMRASLGLHYGLSSSLALWSEYRVKKGLYEDAAGYALGASNREDSMHQIDMKLTYALEENIGLYLAGKYLENNSDYVVAEYEKSVGMCGVSLSY